MELAVSTGKVKVPLFILKDDETCSNNGLNTCTELKSNEALFLKFAKFCGFRCGM